MHLPPPRLCQAASQAVLEVHEKSPGLVCACPAHVLDALHLLGLDQSFYKNNHTPIPPSLPGLSSPTVKDTYSLG